MWGFLLSGAVSSLRAGTVCDIVCVSHTQQSAWPLAGDLERSFREGSEDETVTMVLPHPLDLSARLPLFSCMQSVLQPS